jgi:hypothetical protein
MAMNDAQKADFIRGMTSQALMHLEKTPNVPDARGGMSHDKKMAFVAAMAKHGLRHFDAGGRIPDQATTVTPPSSLQGTTNGGPGTNIGASDYLNPGNKIIPFGTNIATSGTKAPIEGVTDLAKPIGNAAQDIASSFTAQNGFQANLAPTETSEYGGLINQAAGQTLAGYGNVANTQAEQEALAQSLEAQAQGNGPNTALSQLNQTTGQNVSNQAALMAGQRGASANAGLIARQAAQQGAATEQNAVAQAATLRQQQQLAAQQQLAQQQGAIAGETLQEQEVNNQLFNAASGAQNAQNMGAIQNYNNAQTINAATAQNNVNSINKTTSGVLGGVGSLASSVMGMFAEGGDVPSNGRNVTGSETGAFDGLMKDMPGSSSGGSGGAGIAGLAALFSKGGEAPKRELPKHLESIAIIFHPEHHAKGGFAGPVKDMKQGGKVTADSKKEKATQSGNSLKNDKIPAMLSEHEVVLPRTVTLAKDAPARAAEFMRKVIAKRNGRLR